MLSEKEGEGELGGNVMELIKLGPLSILHKEEGVKAGSKHDKHLVRQTVKG